LHKAASQVPGLGRIFDFDAHGAPGHAMQCENYTNAIRLIESIQIKGSAPKRDAGLSTFERVPANDAGRAR